MWHGWQIRYAFIRPECPVSNPPILFVHGFGASIGHWHKNLPYFAARHTVYAIDLLGFGGSEKAAVPYNINLWVEQVRAFWQTFIRRPMIVVGNSIGSLVALAVAHTYPEMVQGVAMLSLPDPSVREDMIPAWCRPVLSRIERAFTSAWFITPLFYWVRRPQVVRPWVGLAYAKPDAIDEDLVTLLTTPARDRGAAQAFTHLLQAMIQPQFGPKVSAILPTLNQPMLLLWGRQDRMVPPALAQTFAALNPQIQLVELDEAGHCPHHECAEDVNAIIADWIQSRCSPTLSAQLQTL